MKFYTCRICQFMRSHTISWVASEYWEKIQQEGSVVLLERSPAVGDLSKSALKNQAM
ncbi:MAG: hypothetical protein HWQ38_14205 [Nostoc sp. NMS7]|uniref:hypothetical protein n=1 Tax=Nostoc sp. NMS7 TaxID=2815391 RepID=UPI0025FEDF90|nr:hypothetical protein [Nostoc sp. NMS7]MBN3947551.1 hypothetical protein [Nostoc sp. NMS7]